MVFCNEGLFIIFIYGVKSCVFDRELYVVWLVGYYDFVLVNFGFFFDISFDIGKLVYFLNI